MSIAKFLSILLASTFIFPTISSAKEPGFGPPFGAAKAAGDKAVTLPTVIHTTDNFPLSYVNYSWDDDWVYQSRLIFSFNDNDRLTDGLVEFWNTDLEIWEPHSRNEYVSGADGKLDSLTNYRWNSGWDPNSLATLIYDDQGRLVHSVSATYLGEWVNFVRYNYIYDDDDRVIERLIENWNAADEEWVSSSRTTFIYTGELISEQLDEAYIANQWEIAKRTLFTYSGDLETEYVEQVWTGTDWLNNQRHLKEYSDGLLNAYTRQSYNEGNWTPFWRQVIPSYDSEGRVLVQETHTHNGIEWVNGTRSEYEYAVPTDVGDHGDNPLPEDFSLTQNYPNPFNPITNIEFALPVRTEVSLDIYNIMGQKVQSLVKGTLPAGSHTVTWDGTDLSGVQVATGVYFYRLKAGDDIETRKMLLMK